MASQFAKNLQKKLDPFAGGRRVRVVNSTRTQFDASTDVVICHGKKLIQDFRINHEEINRVMISKKILNEACIIVLTRNITEVLDYTELYTDEEFRDCASRLGRTISMYGFADKSMCTVCLDEGMDKDDAVVCPQCQAGVCVPCFARCVRARVDPDEVFPNEFKCPTCNVLNFTCELVGKSIKLRPTENYSKNFWDVLDATCLEGGFQNPKLFLDHPKMPFRYSARISLEGGLARIDTGDAAKVVKMATTEGAIICIGDFPRACRCGGDSCVLQGSPLNGKAFTYTNSLFVEIRNGFPLVLSWLWNE